MKFSKDPTSTVAAFGLGGVFLGLMVSLFFHRTFYIRLDSVEHESIATLKTLLLIIPLSAIVVILLFLLFLVNFIKKHTAALEATNRLFENVLNSLPQRIFWKNTEGVYQGANKLFLQDCNVQSLEELCKKSDKDLNLLPSLLRKCQEQDNQVLQEGKQLKKLRSSWGIDESIQLEGNKVPLKNQNGEVIGIIGIYEDITKTLAQEALIIRQARLAQMGEMISMIAHQWRQPLNAISVLSGAIKLKAYKDDLDTAYLLERLGRIEEQTQHLSSTIDDFRNFFKPDILKSEVSAKTLVEDALKIIKPSLEDDEISLFIDFAHDEKVLTHRNKVIQVLLTIIKNAQDAIREKKVEDGTIFITTKKEDGRLIISIKDNAGGINKDVLEQIFLPYFSTKAAKNGTGLGLYMSKIIIEEHCMGKLEALNANGGACFKITF